ncbi:MAG: hypothetical protein ACTSYA_10180 [Candidatus Kariarchaeaceae archaeon]
MKETLQKFLPDEDEKKAFYGAIVLIFVALITEIIFLGILPEVPEERTRGWVVIFLSLFSSIPALYIWYRYVPRYAPAVVKFIITNFVGKRLIGGGSFAYYEYRPEEETETYFKPISKLIALLIAFLGIAVTLAKLLSQIINFNPKTPTESWLVLILWVILMIIIPIILTPIIPVTWALEDTKIKAWKKGTKTNWMISSKYKARFNSLITIGAISAGMGLGGEESFWDNFTLFMETIWAALTILFIPITIIVFFYYSYFRKVLLDLTKESVKLDVMETSLVLREKKTEEIIEKAKEKVVEEAIEEEIIEEVSETTKEE